MNREWYRGIQWRADGGEKVWAPVIQRAAETWAQLELLSVSEGVRSSALLFINYNDLATATRDCALQGLQLTCVAPGRFAVHPPGLGPDWVRASNEQDHETMGRFLGYPECCRRAFAETWVAGRDHLAAMPVANGPWTANIFLRTLGVRLVPHLPCSATCEETIKLAEQMVVTGMKAGLDMAPLEALLRLPATWDARNGIAIITTPVFRLCVSCDVEGHEVREREGQVIVPSPAVWEDNGFTSEAAMRAAHGAVLAAIGPEVVESVLDLGCGDGALLDRIPANRKVGVEVDGDRAARGAARRPHIEMWCGKIEELPTTDTGRFAVVLLMPGRLLEMDAVTRSAVKEKLDAIADRIVLYTYGDHGPLAQLAERAGFALKDPVTVHGFYQAAEATVC